MGDVSSAIPNDLISYGGNAESHNGQLKDWAKSVTTALDALRNSKPDPGLLPAVPDLGAVLNAYAVKKEAIDKFVYDVGMAFMMVSNKDWNSPVTISDDALNKELDKEEGSQGRDYADQVASGKIPLDQALAMIGDDPIETAAFFKELGAPETVLLAGRIDDPGLLQKFDEALATATQSPTWDPSFTDQLVNGDWYPFEAAGVPSPQQRWAFTANLLKYGVYSDDFLTKLGDAYLFHNHDDGINHGAQLALAALGRNPDVALTYLNGTDPTDGGRTRMTHLLENGVGLSGDWQMPEDLFKKYQQQINQQLGLTTLAANDAPDATPESQAKLLGSISKVPVADVPGGFRDVVTDLIGLDMNLFGDKLPPADPKHPEDATNSPLSWEERQRLFLIAMYDMDPNAHQLMPNDGRIATLREDMLAWAMQNGDLSKADPTVWLHNAASMNALMSDGLAAFPYYQEELAKQQEEFNAVFMGVVLSVALPFGAVGLGTVGVGELTAAGIEAATHIAIEITDTATKGHPAPAWEAADEQLNSDLITARANLVVGAYEHDPNASWIPPDLRGKPLDNPDVQHYLASVAKANDTSDLPDQHKHDGTNVTQAGQLITELNSYSGLFKLHDPQQVQEMMQH